MQADKREASYQDVYKQVFMFINSSSGGGVGKQILDKKIDEEIYHVARSNQLRDKKFTVNVLVHYYNMKVQESRNKGFKLLKQKVDQKQKVIGVICGGDGTVMWVVQELYNFKIDPQGVPLAVIPLGTGNDFSQTLNWGKEQSDLLDNDAVKLKHLISDWISAPQENLDIWCIEAQCQEYGKFQKVQNEKNKQLEGKRYQKHFCNYCSIGVDGKIGYSFDRHRTSSRLGNLAMYGMVGLAKNFTKTKTIGELIQSFKKYEDHTNGLTKKQEIQNSPLETNNQAEKKMTNQLINQNTLLEQIIFQHGTSIYEEFESNQNLLALNINSLMGGVVDIWQKAKTKKHLEAVKFSPSSHSDGKLEFVSWGGGFSMAMEKTLGGFADRVCQGGGPFEVIFKKVDENVEKKHRTYLQIDGQFIRFTHPKRVVIKKSYYSQNGQVRVLKKVQIDRQRRCC